MTQELHENIEYPNDCFYINSNSNLVWKKRPKEHFNTQHGCNIFNAQHAEKIADKITTKGYYRVRLGNKSVYSHRIIFQLSFGFIPEVVDHVDGDTLNNNPTNLRIATNIQNSVNKHYIRGSSKYKGVSWSVDKNKWRVYCNNKELGVFDNGRSKQKYVGQSSSEIEAALLYDRYVENVYGEYAWLNRDHFQEIMEVFCES